MKNELRYEVFANQHLLAWEARVYRGDEVIWLQVDLFWSAFDAEDAARHALQQQRIIQALVA